MKVNVGIASLKEREQLLSRSMASLLESSVASSDELRFHLYLNGYHARPSWMDDFPIETVACDPDNFGDRGKFQFDQQGYCLTCDDDIVYPVDYVGFTLSKIEEHQRQAVISYMGKLVPGTVESFYQGTTSMHFNAENKADTPVDIPGTGVMGWHSDGITFPVETFRKPNMADIYAGILSRERGVKVIYAAHPADWFESIRTEKNIFRRYRLDDPEQTELVNSVRWR